MLTLSNSRPSSKLIRDYSLDDLNTRDIAVVSSTVVEIQQDIFPEVDTRLVSEVFRDTESLFEGSYWDYQGMDTVYHDLEHTLQATLCWVRIMANRHLLESESTAKRSVRPITSDS